ncbi:PQQ-binding-like beta-propeller repeat protein [Archangium gephyra]|uniref:PQQ-binding-like beta-propeller repeat protein n=1 Tax=Archangium gephyra TaxID=48 RepID=UPI0035D52388
MKLRKIFGALLALGALEGCDIKGSCKQDAECPEQQFCHTEVKQCFSSRYSDLKILTLGENAVVGGAPIQIQARLELESGANPVYPPQLNLTVTPASGGTPTTVTLSRTAEGTYSAEWTPPPGEGTYTLQVAHPASWGPTRSVQVTVDRTAPALAVQVPEAQPATPKDGFSYADPMAGSAWVRDQTVTVLVESDSADIDPASPRVVVRGHNGDTDVTDLAVRQVTPCTKTYCGEVDVPLWRPGLEAFRGTFQIELAAKDRVGNERSATGSIPVTRWKWAFDGASGPILSTPAIGEKGTVYFGTSGTNGKVFALNPEGTPKWEAPLGPVSGSPTVGRAPDGTERIYVGAAPATSGGVLFSLNGNTGNTISQCPEAGRNLGWGPILSGTTLFDSTLGPGLPATETAMAFSHRSAVIILGPDVNRCGSLGSFGTMPGSSVLSRGLDVYYSSAYPPDPPFEQFMITALNFTLGTSSAKEGYSVPEPRAPVTSMAFAQTGTETYLLTAEGESSSNSGGIQAFDAERGNNATWNYPSSFSGVAPVRNLALGAGNVLFFGHEVATGSAPLTAIDLFATAPRLSVPNAGSFPGGPVLGAGGALYTASATGPAAGIGEVSAWGSNNLTLRWKLSDSVGRAQATPSLDCARQADGTPAAQSKGVLYVPALDGRLYALVVDSPGLDKNAPWPKYQRDARNTGNSGTPITNCP